MSLGEIVSKIIQIQKKKLAKKGIQNVILGVTIFVSIFVIAHFIGKRLWPSTIQDPSVFLFKWSIILHTLCQCIYLLVYLPGYLGISSYHEQHKINKRSLWPWQRPNWAQLKNKIIRNIIINQFISYSIMVYISSKLTKVRFQGFPSLGQLFLHFFIVYYTQDFFFYWAHRMFHTFPFLYKMHKIHHQYDKIFTAVTQYFHPLDFILANLLPSSIGFLVLGHRAHCFTFLFWIAFKLYTSLEGHSGYEFPWSPLRALPLISGASFHDHHHSNNVGNYAGSCYLWDVVLGTGEQYFSQFLKDQKNN